MRRAVVATLVITGCAKRVAPPEVAPPAPQPVWIDTDPSVGVPDRDVDDGLALLQALRSPELSVVGVSTVFGNAPLDQADPIGRALVDGWAPDVPVHTGAAGPGFTPTPASEALADALRAGPLTVLALGPATNVATALATHPELQPNLLEVVAVMGRLPGQRFTTGTTNPRAHRDFNFEQDPDAVAFLLDHGVMLTLAGFELSRTVWVGAGDIADWAQGPNAAPLTEPAMQWLALWQRVFGVDGFNPFDTLAVGALTSPSLMTCAPRSARIEVGPDDRTEAAMQGDDVVTKPYLVVRDTYVFDGQRPPATVIWCHDVQPRAFLDDLRHRLLRPGDDAATGLR